MTINGELILGFLKKNYGTEYTKQEIADALGFSVPTVTGTMNFLVKNGLATKREEEIEVEHATETKKAKIKKVMHHTLTEEGLAYDPVAAEEAKQAAKQAEKERKAAERAAKKAAKEAEE